MQGSVQSAAARPLESRLGVVASLLLLVAVVLNVLPGLAAIPPIDRDEPRYTQATKQMLETGDYVRIRFQEAPRNKKPIGIHWLQAAAVTLSGEGPGAPLWVYRLPSTIGAAAAILLAVWMAAAFLPMRAAVLVGVLLGAAIIVGVEARLAKTDAVLLATVIATQGALARIWLGEAKRWGMPVLFWLALSAGILVKGPIAPMVAALTVAVLAVVTGRRLVGRLRPLTGLLIVAATCLPWFVAIYVATDGAFFANAIGNDFLGKAASGQEGHWAPPLTHLGLFFAVAWPLSAFAIAAVWRIWRLRGPAFLFAAAWVIPSWIVFEATPTKLPHYTLPLIPGIALAVVAALLAADPPKLARGLAAALIAVVPVALLAAIPAGFIAFGTAIPWAALALVAVAAVAGILGARALWRGASPLAPAVVAPTIASAVIAQAAVWGLALPALTPVWVSTRLVAAVHAAATCPDPRLMSVGGYNEPSMIFLAGTETGLTSPEEAVAALRDGCAVIVSRERTVAAVHEAAEKAGVPLKDAGLVEGFNISKGDPVRLSLFVKG